VTDALVDSARLPDPNLLRALGALLESDVVLATLAARVRDPRLDAGRFELLLRGELLDLYRWAAARLLQASQGESIGRAGSRVLCLLPRVAPAVHTLRRAVPFAGLPTACGLRNPQFKWTSNDIFDIDALSVAVAYCDVVVTDKQAADALRRGRFPERLGSQVFTKLDELADVRRNSEAMDPQHKPRLLERLARALL
jgi:hypothetical protein